MKVLIVILFFLLISPAFICGQTGDFWGHPEAQNFLDSNNLKQGTWLETNYHWVTESKYFIGNYINNKRIGLWIEYKNGKILTTAYYLDDQLDGVASIYDKKGKILRKIEFKNGKIDGTVEYYHNGKLMAIYSYKNNIFNKIIYTKKLKCKIDTSNTMLPDIPNFNYNGE